MTSTPLSTPLVRLVQALALTALAVVGANGLVGCSPAVHAPDLPLARAAPLPPPLVERLVPSARGAQALALTRAKGRYSLLRVRVDREAALPMTILLESGSGERLQVRLDYPESAPPFPFAPGDDVLLRYAVRHQEGGAGCLLALLDSGERLRLILVRRSPDTPPWPREEDLPGGLEFVPGIEESYAESSRRPSFCVCRMSHLGGRLHYEGGTREVWPGEWVEGATNAGEYVFHLAELRRPSDPPCPESAPLLSYLLFFDSR